MPLEVPLCSVYWTPVCLCLTLSMQGETDNLTIWKISPPVGRILYRSCKLGRPSTESRLGSRELLMQSDSWVGQQRPRFVVKRHIEIPKIKLFAVKMWFEDDIHEGVNQDTTTNQDRRIVRSFWQDALSRYESGELPKDLFDSGTWMHRANDYRRVVEPLDIANYYVRDLP